MIVKRAQTLGSVDNTVTRAELREALVELWAEIFVRELRADLEAEAEASGERARLDAIERARPTPMEDTGSD